MTSLPVTFVACWLCTFLLILCRYLHGGFCNFRHAHTLLSQDRSGPNTVSIFHTIYPADTEEDAETVYVSTVHHNVALLLHGSSRQGRIEST
ncbi:hypothetical protein EDD17DRAFT_422147 [Pisolithus thermaeus]|nr:hypothetical protein EDD17DRAFT_422147 [Pisolithus thermaeus]